MVREETHTALVQLMSHGHVQWIYKMKLSMWLCFRSSCTLRRRFLTPTKRHSKKTSRLAQPLSWIVFSLLTLLWSLSIRRVFTDIYGCVRVRAGACGCVRTGSGEGDIPSLRPAGEYYLIFVDIVVLYSWCLYWILSDVDVHIRCTYNSIAVESMHRESTIGSWICAVC